MADWQDPRRGENTPRNESKDSQRRLAICSVKLSMYICRVAFPDVNLSVSLSTALTRSSSTAGYRRPNEYRSPRESRRADTSQIILKSDNIPGMHQQLKARDDMKSHLLDNLFLPHGIFDYVSGWDYVGCAPSGLVFKHSGWSRCVQAELSDQKRKLAVTRRANGPPFHHPRSRHAPHRTVHHSRLQGWARTQARWH